MNNITLSSAPRRWRSRYSVLLFMWFAWMISYLDRMVMNISLPYIGAEFMLDKAQQGWIASAFFVGYGISQIPGGFFADRFGARTLMAVAVVWFSVFTSLTGVVTTLGAMLLVRFLFGLGEGVFPAASWKTLSTYFPVHERGRATAIQTSVGTLGPAFASIIGAGIILAYGWQSVFIWLGFPGYFVAIGLYYYCRNKPKDSPGISQAELDELATPEEIQPASPTEKQSNIAVFKMPIIWKLAIVWLFFNAAIWGFTTWLPSYLMEARGLSLTKTGFLGALPFLVGTLGIFVGGICSDKFPTKRVLIYIITVIGGAISLYLMYAEEDLMRAMMMQAVGAFFMYLGVGLFYGILMASVSNNVMGTASGIINTASPVAGVIAPPVMGYLIKLSGGSYESAFLFVVISLIVSAVVMTTIRTKKVGVN